MVNLSHHRRSLHYRGRNDFRCNRKDEGEVKHLSLLFILLLAGCGDSLRSEAEHRFEMIHEESTSGAWIKIFIDKDTGDKYLWIGSGTGGSLTKM
jgi:hypothetical protein